MAQWKRRAPFCARKYKSRGGATYSLKPRHQTDRSSPQQEQTSGYNLPIGTTFIMFLATWNIHRFQVNKTTSIEEVVLRSDFACLAETLGNVPHYDDWQIVNCVYRENRNSGPSCGGVTLIVQPHRNLRVRHQHLSKHIQAICATVMTVPVVACYISPQTPIDDFPHFLHAAQKWLEGPGVLIGDLSNRDRSWDTTSNRRGPALRKWAAKHGFSTKRPNGPTMEKNQGYCRVDLFLHCSRIAPRLEVGGFTDQSDHAPVYANPTYRNVDSDIFIPLLAV